MRVLLRNGRSIVVHVCDSNSQVISSTTCDSRSGLTFDNTCGVTIKPKTEMFKLLSKVTEEVALFFVWVGREPKPLITQYNTSRAEVSQLTFQKQQLDKFSRFNEAHMCDR